ncbi:Cna B-type domain-containing protein [uncultured Methanobrevibacter sp.]|uniref:Cna B-type domain-containing protein n=1 Tax=uncultured Methanobrevibacter sp. TaxID=253161 RepID=UPI002639856D|nr:Cna B-type domain-containing protein [uncultured Methanobrevibacter sp.]
MNKKLLMAGVFAIFLLLSICVISAVDSNASGDVVTQDDSVKQVDDPIKQDDSVKQAEEPVKQDDSVKQADNPVKQKTISVKVKWVGDSSKIPGSVTVKLMRGGSVVDTAVLSPANSWSATFKVTGDGSYSVVESQNGFTASVSGNANSGFVITNKIASNDVLGAADDENANDGGDNTADGNGQDDSNPADDSANDVGADDTNNTNDTDDNTTDDVAPIADSTQDNNTGASNSTDTSKKSEPVAKQVVKQKVVKHTKKTPTKVNHKTGIPMVILVLAVMVAAFVPFARRKK